MWDFLELALKADEVDAYIIVDRLFSLTEKNEERKKVFFAAVKSVINYKFYPEIFKRLLKFLKVSHLQNFIIRGI